VGIPGPPTTPRTLTRADSFPGTNLYLSHKVSSSCTGPVGTQKAVHQREKEGLRGCDGEIWELRDTYLVPELLGQHKRTKILGMIQQKVYFEYLHSSQG